MYHTDPSPQPSPEDHPQPGDFDKPSVLNRAGQRQLALVKRGRRYVFDYTTGQETELLQRLADMARDPSCSLGMFDVAVLSHQVGRGLNQQVQELLQS